MNNRKDEDLSISEILIGLTVYSIFYRDKMLFWFFRVIVDMVLLWHRDVVLGGLAFIQINAVFVGDLGKLDRTRNRKFS